MKHIYWGKNSSAPVLRPKTSIAAQFFWFSNCFQTHNIENFQSRSLEEQHNYESGLIFQNK